jgi:parallel beta-helix repeat protein
MQYDHSGARPPSVGRPGLRASIIVAAATFLGGIANAQMTVNVTPDGPIDRCTGQSVAFSVSVSGGTAPYAYQWTKNGVDIPSAVASTYSIFGLTLSDDATYNCKVTDATLTYVDVVDPTGSYLDVEQPAQVLTHPSGSLICVGTTVSMTATYAGDPAPSVEWRRNGSPIANGPSGFGSTYAITSGAGTTTLDIVNAQSADAASYTVVVSNQCGAGTFTETSNPAVLTADTTLPVFTNCGDVTIFTDPGLCTGTFSFTPAATDNCGVATISGPVNDVLAAGAVYPYNFSVTDTAGNVANCTMNVTVVDNEPPVLTVPAAPVFVANATTPLVVNFTVTATDNCSASVTCVPPSGSVFPAGRTTVACSAFDGVNTVNSFFDVFVCDTDPAPAVVYVDASWTGLPNGTDVGSSRTIGCDAFATIQAGVNAVAVGGSVQVASGIYDEDVTISGKTVQLIGSGNPTIRGVSGGPSATVFVVSSSNVEIAGFTITRNGNTVATWNDPTLNSNGLLASSSPGLLFRDNVVTGNRNGVNLQFMTNATLRNNVVDDNRTGMQMVDNVTNSLVTQNTFRNNWTMGVLFRNEVPAGSDTTGTVFVDNDISGNWYGQIEYRLGGGTTAKNFSGNWLGTTTPVVVATNGGEPGYAAQIPVAFGGTAVPPGGQPDVKGDGSASFDITPMLASGVDTDVDGGFGTNGFQGDFSSVVVTPLVGQTGSTGRIQEGTAVVSTGGLVSVQAGTFVENCSVQKRCTIDGAGSGGNGAANPAVHTIVQAAVASSPAIALASSGLDASNRLVVSDLRTIGASGSGGVATATAACDHFTLLRVTSVSNQNGVLFGVAGGTVDDARIEDCVLSSHSSAGFRIASSTISTTNVDIVGGEMRNNNTHGFILNEGLSATCFVDDVVIDGTTFENNGSIIAGNGTGHVSFFGFNGSAELRNLTMSGSAFVPVQFRGLAPATALGTVVFDNVAISGSTPRPSIYIQVYTDITGVSFSGVDLSGMTSTNAPGGFFSNGGMILAHTGPSIPLGDTIFPCQGAGYFGLGLGGTGGATASCSTVFSGATTLAQKEACVLDVNDAPGIGDVTFDDVTFPSPPTGGAICEGQPFTFTVTAGGLGPFTYQWRKDGVDIGGETGTSYSIGALALSDAGAYDVVVTGACGPETSAVANLTVIPLPVAPSSASASPSSVCYGVGGNVTLNAVGGSGATLQWFDDVCGGNLIGTGNGLVVAAPLVDTTYFARWTDTCGDSSCASTTVTVQPVATADAGGPYVACYLAPVAVVGSASNHSNVQWTSSGTGTFSAPNALTTDYLPSLADATAGTVTLTLTVDPIAPCLAQAVSNATVTISGSPSTVYVDDDYVGLPLGTAVNFPHLGGGPTYVIGCDAFATIQAGVNAIPTAGTVNVAGGTYAEDVVMGKTCSVIGAGSATCTVIGQIGGDVATFRFNANGIVVDGFSITRAGNNPVDWNNPGLNSAGVGIQSRTSGTVRNCFIYGNRTGVDVNNSSNIVLRNNVIDDNRTGLIFRNVTDNCTLTENSISDNWTVGVLFLDASVGSNVPLQTALNWTCVGNKMSGNWYGQIVDRQTGGALPLPGANLKNFSGNWLGTTNPVVSTANSAEPGYAAQIPVAYGGTATPPGGQPDVLGPASANFDITPMLSTGVDTDVDNGFGVHGFQGDFSALTVTSLVAQTGAVGRVQEGATLVSTGGLVDVHAGTYVENCVVPKRCTIDGAGSGGNGAANPAVHTIVQAASPSSPAIALGACGLNALDRLVISDLRTTGASGSDGVASATTPCEFVTFERVTSTGNSNGVHFGVGSGVANDVVVDACVLMGNTNSGLRVASATSSFTGLKVVDGEMSGNGIFGFSFNPGGSATCFGDDLDFDGTTFANNGSPATSGSGHMSFFWFNGSSDLKDVTCTGSTRVPVQFRGAGTDGVPGTWSPLGVVTFDNVVISGSSSRPGVYIQLYTDITNVSLSGLDLSGNLSSNGPNTFFSNGGMALDHVGSPLSLGDTKFPCQGVGYVGLALGNVGGAAADCSTDFGGATTLAAKELCVLDGDDFPGLGDVSFQDVTFPSPPSGGTFCEATPFTFTVTVGGLGPFTYQWRKDGVDIGGETGSSYSIASLVPGDSGSYDVVVTGACGPETSAAAILTVTPLPVAPTSASASPQSVCFGVGGFVTLSVSGGSGSDLEWFDDSCGGNFIGNGNGLVVAAPTSDTTYYARWTTVCGQSSCASTTVTVQTPPTASAGGPYSTCDTTAVGVFGTAADHASVLWTTSGSGSFANPTALVTSYTPSPADVTAGTVTLTLTAQPTAPCAVAAVSNATLTVNASPTVSPPASQLVCIGSNASFSVVATGTGISYQWRKDTVPLPGETGPSLTIVGVTLADAGAYDVVVTGLCNTATSLAAYLTVLGPEGDDPCLAIDVSLGGTFVGNNTCSTPQGHLLPLGCGTGTFGSNDVWYAFTARCEGVLTASTCPFTSGGLSTFDSHLSIFSGPPVASLTCPWGPGSGVFTQVVCSNDAPGCFTFSTASTPVVAGTTYYVRLAGGSAGAYGPYVLDVDFDADLTLSYTQPLGAGSIEIKNSGCEPGYVYFSAFTTDPSNAGPGFGNGWFYGLHIGIPEIVTELNWPGGAPFFGVLDGNGESVWYIDGLGSFGGIVIYGVTLTFDPANDFTLACYSDVVQLGPLL